MSAAGIKIATTTTPNTHTVAAADECDVRIKTTTNSEADCALYLKIGAENSSFSTLNSLKEQLTSSCSSNELQQNKVPLENSQLNNRQLRENEAEENPPAAVAINRELSTEFPNNHLQQGDVDNTSATQLSPGLSLLQQTAVASSPPPHSYRHSRAYRHFKNPPQPHMCIRTTTEAGEELFINVLSWTRIVIPQEPSDPIPLYGGMRVPPGSPRSPPIVFAVMANPEVLKDSGRHSKDPEERRAMVELMCDFVEAMNPGVKLVRNAVILKDRDISGELKDVWNAVQAQRDREREEQMLLQRQQHQQHFHNLTNASTNGSLNANTSLTTANNSANATATSQQMFPKSVHSGAAGEAMLMAVDGGTPPRSRKIIHEVQNDNNASNTDVEVVDIDMKRANNSQLSLALLAENLDNKMSLVDGEQLEENQQNNQNTLTNDALSNGNNSKVSLVQERGNKMDINNQLNAINCNKDSKQQQQHLQLPALTNGTAANCNDMEVTNVTKTIIATSTPPNATISAIPAQNPSTTTTAASTPAPAPQAPTKKEKLGGFLPNGCIFPRFTKNNKHKDKDKEKEKETKTKDKEKNVLLNALKKSKDKKSNSTTAAAAAAAALAVNQDEKITSSNSNTTAATTPNCTQTNNKQQKQNCLQQLECGVQKLDLNNHHHNHNQAHTNDNNINNTANTTISNNTSATNKSNSTTSSTSGVGVH